MKNSNNSNEEMYLSMGISKTVYDYGCAIEKSLRERFDEVDRNAEYNQLKVVKAMQQHQVSEACLLGTTGYGYNDLGRDTLEAVYAATFHTEDALVRPQITCGTHALALALMSNLRPGDELLSPVGKPYDTLEEVIGIRPSKGSLAEYGVTYRQVDLLPDGSFDYDKIRENINEKTHLVTIQRSKGYQTRPTLSVQQIGELIGVIAAGLAIGGVLYLLDSAWGYGGAEVPAPQATLMKMIVEGIMGGNLPWNLVFTGVFLAIALEVLRIPVMPFAIGLYLPIYLNTSIMIGGAVRWFMDSRKNVDAKLKEEQTTRGTLFCAGMIAGEGLVGILLAVFAVFGISTALSIDLGNIGGVVLMIVMIACLLAFSMKKKKN